MHGQAVKACVIGIQRRKIGFGTFFIWKEHTLILGAEVLCLLDQFLQRFLLSGQLAHLSRNQAAWILPKRGRDRGGIVVGRIFDA